MKKLMIVCTLLAVAATAWAGAKPNGLVICHTDYGTDSVYVGMLKGAVYTKFPEAKIDTLTNSVPQFDVVSGAFMLAEGCAAFPKGTTFCCVVDPGVGTERKCIVLETKTGQFFIGPDNGLLSLVAEKFGVEELRESTKEKYWRVGAMSTTFHGRDIFGPVAAAVADDVALRQFGPEMKADDMVKVKIPPSRVVGDAARGVVVRVDWYGNMVTNITRDQLAELGIAQGDGLEVTIGTTRYTAPFVRSYGSVPEGNRLVLVQSSGFIECAKNMGSLAEELKQNRFASVVLRKAK